MMTSEGFAKIVKFGNKFNLEAGSSKSSCYPFYIGDKRVGYVRNDVHKELQKYPECFVTAVETVNGNKSKSVHLSSDLNTFEDRSEKIAAVLDDLRRKDVFITLRGWRDESYDVVDKFSDPPLMKMERAATCLFGVKQYGVHINGYVQHPEKGLCMWVGKRSDTKPTFPGQLDQMVAGGLASGQSVKDCAMKECAEEASVPAELVEKMKPVGTVSYFYEDERGLFPECQFVMDLELPLDFTPEISDGEVQSFQLVPIEEMKTLIVSDNFKFNCAMIVLDFLIRHGFIHPDNEPNYTFLIENLHVSL